MFTEGITKILNGNLVAGSHHKVVPFANKTHYKAFSFGPDVYTRNDDDSWSKSDFVLSDFWTMEGE